MLTSATIFRESGQYDKEVIQRLRLERLAISRIASLEGCVSLVELVLSHNEITLIAGLEGLVSLKRLDLSYNRIRRLENVEHLTSLEALDLRGNLISDLRDVQVLSQLEDFRALHFRGVDGEDANPVCSDAQYATVVTKALPLLQVLDGGHVQIDATFKALEDQLKSTESEANAIPTPPPEPWFSSRDLAFCNESDVDAIINGNKAFAGVLEAQAQIANMLRDECSHLLRKSTNSLAKASK